MKSSDRFFMPAAKRLPGLVICVGLACFAALMVVDRAEGATAAQKEANGSPAESAQQHVDSDREQVVLAFVQEHHPELEELLTYLKSHRPGDYQRAVRDLYRASERLAQFRERDPQRYELELRSWQVSSRIQLLVARSMMQTTEELRQQLRGALSEQMELRAQILRLDRAKVADRLEKLDQQLDRLEQNRSQVIERQLAVLLKDHEPDVRAGAPAKKSAARRAAQQKAMKNKAKENKQGKARRGASGTP